MKIKCVKQPIWLSTFLTFYCILSVTAIHNIPAIFKRSQQRIPICEPDSVCGIVQVNSRGLTAFPLCSCPNPGDDCPLVWDSGDGKSVNQGPMQYKHCGEAPRHLSHCLPGETAYTMKIITPSSRDTNIDNSYKISHQVHCICSENNLHVQKDEQFEQIPFVGEVRAYYLSCAPYPTCGESEVCKTISETKSEFLENKLCGCPHRSFCPVVGNRASKTYKFGEGTITQLYCQHLS